MLNDLKQLYADAFRISRDTVDEVLGQLDNPQRQQWEQVKGNPQAIYDYARKRFGPERAVKEGARWAKEMERRYGMEQTPRNR